MGFPVATSQELHRSFKVKTNGKRQCSFHDFHCHCHFFYNLTYFQWFAPRGLSKRPVPSPTITATSQSCPFNSPLLAIILSSWMYICAAAATTGPINLHYTFFRFIELTIKTVSLIYFCIHEWCGTWWWRGLKHGSKWCGTCEVSYSQFWEGKILLGAVKFRGCLTSHETKLCIYWEITILCLFFSTVKINK